MKQSSVESQKKKLVQARLPFQILSPGTKNPETTSSELRKRKASDSSNNDTPACEVTDVKENQDIPVEKKPKIAKIKNVEDGKANNNKQEKEEEKMEIEDEAKDESLNSCISASKGSRKVNTSQKTYKNNKKRNHTRKTTEKCVTKERMDNSKSNEGTVIDIVDLCDSPCKTDNTSDNLSHFENVSNFNVASSSEYKMKEVEDNVNSDLSEDSNNKHMKGDKDRNMEHEPQSDCSEEKADIETPTEQSESVVEVEKNSSKQSSDTEECKTDVSSLPLVKDSIESTKPMTSQTSDVTNETESNSTNNTCNTEKENISSSTKLNTPSNQSQSSLDDLARTPSLNESSTSIDVSISSDCSTPVSKSDTPKSSKKQASKTPRRMTPKQVMKMKERETKLKEREQLKQEKEKKKAEEKEEKQKLKQEKEEERMRQKQEKEEEKRKEKEEKEKKKQAEIAQKNEDKRLKEEEKRLKEEEKRAKEEEKKKREEEERKKKEEKRLKEEQKEAEKRKSAQAFASFFLKAETKTADGEEENENVLEDSKFQPFEVKNDMRLAPLVRSQLTEDRRKVLDCLFDNSLNKSVDTYLKELCQPSYIKGAVGKTWPAPDIVDDDIIIIESEKTNGEMEVDSITCEKKSEKKRQRAKLLQFHENRRPPYWGTWRKKSKFVRPRAPFNEDKKIFEYDVDSDDEWEEPEDGESLRGSENEESEDEQYEEDNDMFVPHGYLSDEEGQDDLDDKSPEAMKAKLKFLQMEFEAEMSKKQEKLKPRLIGCVWFCNSDTTPSTVGSHIAELFLTRRAVWDGPLPLRMTPAAPPTPPTPSDVGETEETRGAKRKLVPESMIPTVIHTIHGSRKKLTRLLAEILDPCEADQRPSKRCLVDKVREIASWTKCTERGHHCWYVKEDVRQAYSLMDLTISPLPSAPTTPKANITKFTKVLTSDERLRLLSVSKEIPKSTTKATNQCVDGVNNSSPRLPTAAKPGPPLKKRIAFTTVGPVQSANSLTNFVTTKNKVIAKNPTSETNKAVESEDKVKKRITPITLTSKVSKVPPASQEECIVLSD